MCSVLWLNVSGFWFASASGHASAPLELRAVLAGGRRRLFPKTWIYSSGSMPIVKTTSMESVAGSAPRGIPARRGFTRRVRGSDRRHREPDVDWPRKRSRERFGGQRHDYWHTGLRQL